MPFPIIGVLAAVVPIIERLWPDPQKAAEAKLRLFELQQQGDLDRLAADVQLAIGQLEINKEEAKAGPFRGGWRPFIGWVCGFAFAFNFVLLPLANAVATYLQFTGKLPGPLDFSVMSPVMLGLLGLGGMRSYEKAQGQA